MTLYRHPEEPLTPREACDLFDDLCEERDAANRKQREAAWTAYRLYIAGKIPEAWFWEKLSTAACYEAGDVGNALRLHGDAWGKRAEEEFAKGNNVAPLFPPPIENNADQGSEP